MSFTLQPQQGSSPPHHWGGKCALGHNNDAVSNMFNLQEKVAQSFLPTSSGETNVSCRGLNEELTNWNSLIFSVVKAVVLYLYEGADMKSCNTSNCKQSVWITTKAIS